MTPPRSYRLMHTINDDMRARSTAPADEPLPFFCECNRDDCFLPVWLTPAEYDLIVRHEMSVIIAGHEEIEPEPRQARGSARALVEAAV